VTAIARRRLGHSGLEVSVVGLGCNNFGGRLGLDRTREVLDACLEHGLTFLDTADRYGATRSEEFLGELLAGRRERVVLATKFGLDLGDGYEGPRGAPAYIRRAAEASLRRLRTDVIDLYWYHRPDGITPIADTLGALHDLVQAGTVRAIGASNFSVAQIEEADMVAREHGLTRFTAIQNEYSLLVREPETDGVLAACERLELGFVPFYPLASGLLTGKYSRVGDRPAGARLSDRDQLATEQQWSVIEALTEYARQRQLTLVQVAIGGLLAQRAVASVIGGATRPEQVVANAAAAAWQPGDSDRVALDELLEAAGSRT
jgi:aryl-alcohol dehydrogenase-like predicted oxidoreductase